MSSTPLFDSLRQVRTTDVTTSPAARPGSAPAAVPAAQQPVPASPIDAPALVHDAAAVAPVAVAHPDTTVPAGLVSAIDAIPARLRATLAREHQVSPEDLPFVEAIADALTRAVVDAVVTELDRIATTGLVRG
jgi:hypothetical protein